MPFGYYLAQGLIPLGPSSSDDEEGPCELPDGRVVCGPHGLVTCGKCCTSYDFMNEDDSDADSFWASEEDLASGDDLRDTPLRPMEPQSHMLLRKGTGKAFFSKFPRLAGPSIMAFFPLATVPWLATGLR